MDRISLKACLMLLLSALLLFASPLTSRARAQDSQPLTLSLGADVAVPVAGPLTHRFDPGASATVAVHQGITPWFAIGGRGRFGLLADSARRDATRTDAGIGMWGSAMASARFRLFGDFDDRRATGALAEIGAGVAVTGPYVEPAGEVGIGFGLPIGDVSLVPSVRVTYIAPLGAEQDSMGAWVGLAGIDVVLFDRPAAVLPLVPEEQPEADPPGDTVEEQSETESCSLGPEDLDGFEDDDHCLDPDDDQDGILDVADACPREPETVNGVDDGDGCPDTALVELVEDHIVLDDRVFFETNRAHIRRQARPTLDALARLIGQHPEWSYVRIEGHADRRGSEALNQRLSERRAAAVRDALVRLGIPANNIQVVGFGETRPADEDAHHENRRVEFLVVRHIPAGEQR